MIVPYEELTFPPRTRRVITTPACNTEPEEEALKTRTPSHRYFMTDDMVLDPDPPEPL